LVICLVYLEFTILMLVFNLGGMRNITAGSVTSQTSFQNLLDWGVKAADVESLLGKTLPSNLQTLIKDWASSKGIVFSEVKTKLQALVDAAK
jgi:hypothetical protein